MLERTLILMAIQWAGACLCYALARFGRKWSRILAWVLGGVGFLLSAAVSPVGMLQFLFQFAAAMICLKWNRLTTARFALVGIAGSVLSIAAVDWYAEAAWAGVVRKFPLESLAGRLAYETRQRGSSFQTAANESGGRLRDVGKLPADEALKKLDDLYDVGPGWGIASRRMRSLRFAHREQVKRFENVEESFGVRRVPAPSPRFAERLNSPPIRFRVAKRTSSGAGSSTDAAPFSTPAAGWIESYHRQSLWDFANLAGWGYVQDREHVAGFESHGFDDYPHTPDGHWKLLRIELVSLLKHDEPGVYVSEFLPAMNELREAPVRPLDGFERRSLAALEAGGEIEVQAAGEEIRMLGAIRAADKCLHCHSVEHGELLGAFSYVLLPTTATQYAAPIQARR